MGLSPHLLRRGKWKPNVHSPLMEVTRKAYIELTGKEPEVLAIHAGLECGLFLKVRPDMEMISFGPTLRDVHSPAERCHIPSSEKDYQTLTLSYQ